VNTGCKHPIPCTAAGPDWNVTGASAGAMGVNVPVNAKTVGFVAVSHSTALSKPAGARIDGAAKTSAPATFTGTKLAESAGTTGPVTGGVTITLTEPPSSTVNESCRLNGLARTETIRTLFAPSSSDSTPAAHTLANGTISTGRSVRGYLIDVTVA